MFHVRCNVNPSCRFAKLRLRIPAPRSLYTESRSAFEGAVPATNRQPGAPMIDELYNNRILDLAGNIGRIGRLAAPDGTATAHSKLCGSTVTVDLQLRDGVVSDFAHEVRACALGQASSAVMARHVVGASVEELRAVREAMLLMLKTGGAPPEGRFEELRYLEPVREHKARHASTMLTFDAVVAAIDAAEAKGRAAA